MTNEMTRPNLGPWREGWNEAYPDGKLHRRLPILSLPYADPEWFDGYMHGWCAFWGFPHWYFRFWYWLNGWEFYLRYKWTERFGQDD